MPLGSKLAPSWGSQVGTWDCWPSLLNAQVSDIGPSWSSCCCLPTSWTNKSYNRWYHSLLSDRKCSHCRSRGCASLQKFTKELLCHCKWYKMVENLNLLYNFLRPWLWTFEPVSSSHYFVIFNPFPDDKFQTLPNSSRLFQTQRVCRWKVQTWWKWQRFLQAGRKHCGKKECFQKTWTADR